MHDTTQETPETVLETLGITSRHPLALAHATRWGALLAWVAQGADDRTACRIAHVVPRTLRDWKLRGAEGKTPFDEFLAAYDEAAAQVIGDVWAALYESAKSGDVRACEALLRRREAKAKAQLDALLGKAELTLRRLQIKQARARLGGEAETLVVTIDDPRWRELQRLHLGTERQGVLDGPHGDPDRMAS